MNASRESLVMLESGDVWLRDSTPIQAREYYPVSNGRRLAAVDGYCKFETVVENMLSESDFAQEMTFLESHTVAEADLSDKIERLEMQFSDSCLLKLSISNFIVLKKESDGIQVFATR